MTQPSVDLYNAVADMRRVTAAGGTFSVSFRKWNRQRRAGGDLVILSEARLRTAPSDITVDNASHKLFLLDVSTGRSIVCWQPLVVSYNGSPTLLT